MQSKPGFVLSLVVSTFFQSSTFGAEVDAGFSSDCRSDPTWADRYDECGNEFNWDPRSFWWGGYMAEEELGEDDILIRKCVQEVLKSKMNMPSNDRANKPLPPIVTRKFPSDEEPVLVEISMALSHGESLALETLAKCVREHLGDEYFEERSFYMEEYDKDSPEIVGGNNVTFLNGSLQIHVPGIAAQLTSVAHLAWKEAGWGDDVGMGYPDPRTLGIRASEELQYGGGDILGPHFDSESIYTLLVALTEPRQYSGGEFYVDDDDISHEFKLQRLHAVIFLSESTYHGVNRISEGNRKTFATEFWDNDDCGVNDLRPSLEDWETKLTDHNKNPRG